MSNSCSLSWSRLFRVKQYELSETKQLDRTLQLFDLLAVGIGGTVGSGIFVLTGLITRDYAGPGVFWSWIIAGIGCFFSAMSYAEMSSRIPSAGSAYAYVYATLGELPAVIAAWCLTLEYGISGAAVARSWGEKLSLLIQQSFVGSQIGHGSGINIYAMGLQALVTLTLAFGVETSKITINAFTCGKMLLVTFMVISGLCIFRPRNLTPLMPYGVKGVLRGATSAFFGYLGFDEVSHNNITPS